MLFTSGLVQPLAELVVLSFHLGQAAAQAMILLLEGLMLLSQHGQTSAQVQKVAVTFLAAGTRRTTGGHRGSTNSVSQGKAWSLRCFNRGASPF